VNPCAGSVFNLFSVSRLANGLASVPLSDTCGVWLITWEGVPASQSPGVLHVFRTSLEWLPASHIFRRTSCAWILDSFVGVQTVVGV